MDKDPEQGEQNLYSEEVREESMESDEISPEEEAFMRGYDEADKEEDENKDENKEKEEKDEESE